MFHIQTCIAHAAAELSAEAANLLVSNAPDELVSAQEKAAEARTYQRANEIIDSMRDPDYKFHIAELKPEIKPKT